MFTRKYFRDELFRFRELMGEKTFYDDLHKPDNKSSRAFYGLIYTYAHTEGLTEDDRIFLEATKLEYEKRLAYMMLLKENAQ